MRSLLPTCLLLPLLAGCQAIKAFTANLSANPKTGDLSGTVEGATGNFYKGLNITAGNNSGLALIVLVIVVVALPFVYPVSRKVRLWSESRRDKKAYEQYARARESRLSGSSPSEQPYTSAFPTPLTVPRTGLGTSWGPQPSKPSGTGS